MSNIIVTTPDGTQSKPEISSSARKYAEMNDLSRDSNFTVEEIQRLYRRFMKLDKNKSGSIDKDEFLAIPQIANNPLAQRLIALFDEDGGGDVDFKEFIKALSIFSAKGKKVEKLEFAFRVYDMDQDGYISNGELFMVLKTMVSLRPLLWIFNAVC